MNIALVSMNASPLGCLGGREGSGQSVYVDGLARALATLGHRVTIYVRLDDPAVPAAISLAASVTLAYVKAGSACAATASELAPWITEFGAGLREAWLGDPPDVIHAFTWMSGKAALAAARDGALPVLQTFLPLAARGRRRDDVLSEQDTLVRSAAGIVAISSAQVFALLSLGARPSTIKLVPCGVDLGQFAPLETRRVPGEPMRIATLGGLGVREGLDDVIAALALVEGVTLRIGGGLYDRADILTDPDAARLHAAAQARGVAERIEFSGRIKRSEAADFLRWADVVVSPPHGDSLGTVALEAMACGVPVIVSAVGGLVDAVADGMTGIHVPPAAPRQIAYALETLRTDPVGRQRFGRFAVERATARYGWSRIAGETFEIYRTVAARTPTLTQTRT